MAENLVAVLRQLVLRKVALQEKERQLGRKEQQILETLGKLLPRIGYRVVAAGSDGGAAGSEGGALTQSNGGRKALKPLKPKRITCPKCDRRFAHPLPLARHLSATHGIRKARKKPAKKTR
jgi:uncharacterized C2H2 Zn-finger protein